MTINLKQIRVFDTDNIKLDKINYNFDQLIVNGGGPKGAIGTDGPIGFQGFQGALGAQGDRGVQGAQGPDATPTASFWNSIEQDLDNDVIATLFSKHPNAGDTPIYAAVIGAGYITTDTGYTNQQINGLPNYQWVINRKRDKVISNLRFTSEDTIGNAFDITMDNYSPPLESILYKLRLGFINENVGSQLNFQAAEHIIRSTAGSGDNLLKVSTGGGEINVNTIFENPVQFNQQLTIDNSGADVDKIAVAIDNTGEVIFKTTTELGGSVKIGTIISILPSIFSDSTKFVRNQIIDTTLNPDFPIQIRMGAGINDYEGWYVCNGEEWTDGNSISFQVPDLNSYSYQIISNPISSDPNSQGYINVNNNEIQLIGGAELNVSAIENGVSSALYDVSLTDNSNEPEIAINNSGIGFKIKKLPQIIYLGNDNLYWSQLGTGQLAVADYSSADYSVVDYNAF
jgi:hypothetical protein